MDICIEKEFTDNTGEQIKAFACNNEKIYVMVNQIETENDTYIEIYDDKNYDLIGKLYFDSELKILFLIMALYNFIVLIIMYI